MKPLLTLAAASLLFSFSSKAQKSKDIPDFGKVDKSEILMKECEFDKHAEAMILFDIGESVCKINYNSLFAETEHHTRIKILTDKGLERANIHIRYRSAGNLKPITHISAQTYNLDAAGNISIAKVEKALIYDKKINKRYSEIIFTFPEVKAGSVIEYKYTDEASLLGDWYFQRTIPVKLSRYITDFSPEIEINSTPYCVLPLDIKKDEKGNSMVNVYTMKDVPALRDEAYISAENDYLQRLETRIIAFDFPGQPRKSMVEPWPKVIKELMDDEDFGMQLKKNIPRTSDLDEMLKKISSPYDKMTTIHNYVRKNMQWNGYDNIWALDGVKSAWKDKKGTSGEINLILVNLLKDAGLNAHPVLVSTRENGRINTTIADYHQFDKVMAYVKIDDNTYTLDATEKYTPSKLIPLDVAASEGLVIEKVDTYEWGWQVLWNPKYEFRNTVVIQAEIDKDGQMKGDAVVSSADYSRVSRMPGLKEGKDKFTEKYFTSKNQGTKVDSLELENEDVDSLPLIQKIHFTQTISSSGDYKYFSANLFSGLEKNPFVADNRFSDIFFGANQRYNIIGSFTIPEGYTFDELPKNLRMIMPDTGIVFTRLLGANDNILSVRITLEFKKPVYSIDEYPEFKEFYKKLYGLLNEQFVIRKKA
jgi:Domain of Unknown Function with PDB structure (DUF3857)/Transglutaminase-like superfamily